MNTTLAATRSTRSLPLSREEASAKTPPELAAPNLPWAEGEDFSAWKYRLDGCLSTTLGVRCRHLNLDDSTLRVWFQDGGLIHDQTQRDRFMVGMEEAYEEVTKGYWPGTNFYLWSLSAQDFLWQEVRLWIGEGPPPPPVGAPRDYGRDYGSIGSVRSLVSFRKPWTQTPLFRPENAPSRGSRPGWLPPAGAQCDQYFNPQAQEARELKERAQPPLTGLGEWLDALDLLVRAQLGLGVLQLIEIWAISRDRLREDFEFGFPPEEAAQEVLRAALEGKWPDPRSPGALRQRQYLAWKLEISEAMKELTGRPAAYFNRCSWRELFEEGDRPQESARELVGYIYPEGPPLGRPLCDEEASRPPGPEEERAFQAWSASVEAIAREKNECLSACDIACWEDFLAGVTPEQAARQALSDDAAVYGLTYEEAYENPQLSQEHFEFFMQLLAPFETVEPPVPVAAVDPARGRRRRDPVSRRSKRSNSMAPARKGGSCPIAR